MSCAGDTGFSGNNVLLQNVPGEHGTVGILLPNFRDPRGSVCECAGVSETGFLGIFPGFSGFSGFFSGI